MASKNRSKGRRRLTKSEIQAAADRAVKAAKGVDVLEEIPEVNPAILNPPETAPGIGRPPKYKPEFCAVARALCKRGATDWELAREFEVSVSTIHRWYCRYPEFWEAIHTEKAGFDDRIERALAQRAVGYVQRVEKVFQFQGSIIRAETDEHIPGDVGAMKHWLANRKAKEWRDSAMRLEIGQPGDFDQMSDDELQDYIAAEAEQLLKTQPRGKKGARQ